MRLWWILILPAAIANENKEWDLLIFTQRWPYSACLQYEEERPNNICILPKPNWSIHGIWPTKLHTEGPGFCDKDAKFDPNLLNANVTEELVEYWSNLESGKTEYSLWEHEWLKHGTCAQSLPSLKSEDLYFGQGLEWFKQFNMSNVLRKGGIVPSDSMDYPVEAISHAVYDVLSINARISCALEKYTKTPYLVEIRICFNKNLALVDCDGTQHFHKLAQIKCPACDYDKLIRKGLLTNCPMSRNIRYPRTLPPLPPKPKVNNTKMWRTILDVILFFDWLL